MQGIAGGEPVSRAKAPGVDAGGNRFDASGRKAVALDELLAQRLSSRNDARRGARVQPAAEGIARHRRRDVARAHHWVRPSQRGERQRAQPGVGRAVRAHHVAAVAPEPAGERLHAREALGRDRQRDGLYLPGRRFRADSRIGRAKQLYIMAAAREALRFRQHPDLLPAPAERRLGVDDNQTLHSGETFEKSTRLTASARAKVAPPTKSAATTPDFFLLLKLRLDLESPMHDFTLRAERFTAAGAANHTLPALRTVFSSDPAVSN